MNKYTEPRHLYEMTMHDPYRYFGNELKFDEDQQNQALERLANEDAEKRNLYRRARYARLVRERGSL